MNRICDQIWVSFLCMRKHRAWGSFLREVPLVSSRGAFGGCECKASRRQIFTTQCKGFCPKRWLRALQSFCWCWEYGSILPGGKSDPSAQWLFGVRFWLKKKILETNSLAQGSNTKGLAGRLSQQPEGCTCFQRHLHKYF